MAHGGDDDFELHLKKMELKFLCCYPLSELHIELLPKSLNWQQQEQILKHTYAHSLNEQFPIKVLYQLNFLKSLITFLEENKNDVYDDIYEAYCDELQRSSIVQSELYAYKHYIMPAFNARITLHESKSFVAKGSTGLCSWQASLALTDYLLNNPGIVEKKTIVEIGAGTGLCGIIVKQCLHSDKYIMTDGSYECVRLMDKNVMINFQSSDKSRPITSLLKWDSINEFPWRHYKQPQLILAADVVYDSSDFSSLIHAINFIFTNVNNNIKMLLAATVRNMETLEQFKQKMETLAFIFEERDVITPDKSHLYWDRSTQIKIFQIKRNQSNNEELKSLCQATSHMKIDSF